MPKIRIVKKCNFTAPDGTVTAFAPGIHTVSADTADHWFVKAHCEGGSEASETSDNEDKDALIADLRAENKELLGGIVDMKESVTAHVEKLTKERDDAIDGLIEVETERDALKLEIVSLNTAIEALSTPPVPPATGKDAAETKPKK